MAKNVVYLYGEQKNDVRLGKGAISPGDLLEKTAVVNEVQRHSTAAGKALVMVAVENTAWNKGLSDDYADGNQVQVVFPQRGDKLSMLLAAGATAVTCGDYLESAGDGTIRIFGSGVALFVAEESVDNSGGGSKARISVTAM